MMAATLASTKINIIQADSVLASFSLSLSFMGSSSFIASDLSDDGIIPDTKLSKFSRRFLRLTIASSDCCTVLWLI